jgi:Rod binding domain-containing protein
MDLSAIQARREAAEVPPEQLVGDKQLTEDQKIGEVSRQFEAILLREILQNTQKTVIPSSFSDNSTAASIYQDMVTRELADSISRSGTLGLARMLQRQLSRQLHPDSSAESSPAPETRPASPSAGDAARLHPFGVSQPLHPLRLRLPTPEAAAPESHE